MFKRILGIAILLFAISFPAFADMTDKATLGGQDSNNNYSWRVDVNHNFIPGTTLQNNIGSSGNQVNTIYAANETISGTQLTEGYLLSAGSANGGGVSLVSSVTVISSTQLAYSVLQMPLTNSAGQVYTLVNGVPGQIVTFTEIGGVVGSDTARITPSTATGFSYAALTATKQSVTMLFINNTTGWVIIGNAGATIA